ncbi:MAG: hypothetical protein ABSC94_17635 [Polyangiaceae bacterium]
MRAPKGGDRSIGGAMLVVVVVLCLAIDVDKSSCTIRAPMRRFLAWSWAASMALSGCGSCAWFPLLPDKRTTVDHAHELDELCEEDAGPLAADALTPSIIESVQAAYIHVNQGAGGDLRLRGVNLHMRPRVNMPVGVLQRALACHEAAVTLAKAPELPDDPYVLPGTWLDIDVSATNQGLLATVLTDNPDDARRVVERAHKFAPSARLVIAPRP